MTRFGYCFTSQNREGGILEEIFRRIVDTNRELVKLGVRARLQGNTLAPLFSGWSRVWIEADQTAARASRSAFFESMRTERLRFIEAVIAPATAEDLFERGAVLQETDLLSINIDGNDYRV